ncbi:hypothetical protein OG689_00275 [Kitasatospora sp. NBC_00240]|nr:hypothetical protein [Kitasatospora sp. NBC_00240]MCX5207768.1 hypothetical protein [Kitasatospora sp. NBC_00240]
MDALSCSVPLTRATEEHVTTIVGELLKAADEIALLAGSRTR